jgi:GNAT superfamily N-acetyltransferase
MQFMVAKVLMVDYLNPQHAADMVFLLDSYACDPMGGEKPLSQEVKSSLVGELAKIPHAFSVICYIAGEPAGLVNCFETFSTFNCKPLVNIHDVIVIKAFRKQNISQLMLDKVEQVAKAKGCCKLTLEVLEGNTVAQNSYFKFGFAGYELDSKLGNAMFWQKALY